MFKIKTAEERMNEKKPIKGAIFGPHGIGKTSLLWTCDQNTTLFLNLEGGDLAVQDCPVDSIDIQSWEDAINMACLVTGPDPSKHPHQPYSQAHYDYVFSQIDPGFLQKYSTIFWDSISVASRLCWQWACGQPEAFSKQENFDPRGAYGLVGRELVRWLTHIQHTPNKNVWVVGGLDEKEDDFGRRKWDPQIEGSKAGLELPGIFDEVISMVMMQGENGGEPYRAFVCQKLNPWNYPAKDRSGRLQMVEEPHLGRLMDKINQPKPQQNFQTTIEQEV